jgi:DNA (cytosine-5)-methyltransferase 1
MSKKNKQIDDSDRTELSDKFTMLSLFAGAGGLDIGLELAGFTTKVINELEPHACESLRQNKALSSMTSTDFQAWFTTQMEQRCYKNISIAERDQMEKILRKALGKNHFLQDAEIIEGDIRGVPSSQFLEKAGVGVGELTLVAGGPPCQPFSRAGKRETVETDDGKLFLEFVRVVNDTRPRWFMFENVKGLMQSRTIVSYAKCCNCNAKKPVPFKYREAALSKTHLKIKCTNCGSIDTEISNEEVRGGSLEIIKSEFEQIGYECHHKLLNAADFGVPQSRERLIIIGSRDHENFEWPTPTHCDFKTFQTIENNKQLDLLNNPEPQLKPWQTVRDVLWGAGHPEFGRLNPSTAVVWVKNVVRPHDEPVCWSLDRPSPTVGAHQAAKLAIAPDGVPDEQLARQQWHTKGRRQSDLPPVEVKHAYLSDRELLSLQTFPQNWYLYGTRMQRAFQIGNAVPPKLAEAVGRAIINSCTK